jgi:hypothetical protein
MKRACILHNFIHPLHTRLHAQVKLSSGQGDVWCSAGLAIRLLDADNRRKWMVSFAAQCLYLRGKGPRYSWRRRMHELHMIWKYWRREYSMNWRALKPGQLVVDLLSHCTDRDAVDHMWADRPHTVIFIAPMLPCDSACLGRREWVTVCIVTVRFSLLEPYGMGHNLHCCHVIQPAWAVGKGSQYALLPCDSACLGRREWVTIYIVAMWFSLLGP